MAAAIRFQACHEIEPSLCYAVLFWVPAPAPHNMPQPLHDCHVHTSTCLSVLVPNGGPTGIVLLVSKHVVNSAALV